MNYHAQKLRTPNLKHANALKHLSALGYHHNILFCAKSQVMSANGNIIFVSQTKIVPHVAQTIVSRALKERPDKHCALFILSRQLATDPAYLKSRGVEGIPCLLNTNIFVCVRPFAHVTKFTNVRQRKYLTKFTNIISNIYILFFYPFNICRGETIVAQVKCHHFMGQFMSPISPVVSDMYFHPLRII